MISSGRYSYHLKDIAEIEAMKGKIDPIHLSRLSTMKQEVREYEVATPKTSEELIEEAAKLAAKSTMPTAAALDGIITKVFGFRPRPEGLRDLVIAKCDAIKRATV